MVMFNKTIEINGNYESIESCLQEYGIYNTTGNPYHLLKADNARKSRPKILNPIELHQRLCEIAGLGKIIIIAPGSYDIVHAGHIYYLTAIKRHFQQIFDVFSEDVYLVACVDSDQLIRKAKGEMWNSEGGNKHGAIPFEKQKQRMEKIATIDSVNFVCPIDSSRVEISLFDVQKTFLANLCRDLKGKIYRVVSPDESYYEDVMKLLYELGNISPLILKMPNIMRSQDILLVAHKNGVSYNEFVKILENLLLE